MQLYRKHRSFLLCTLLTLFTLLLAACGSESSQQPNKDGKASDDKQVLVIPVGGRQDLQTLDPALASDGPALEAINMLYTGLVQLDNKLQVRDQLAASHSVGEDGQTWTFKLKPNLKFSDGSPLTSEDIAYSLDRAFDPELKSAIAAYYLGLIQDSEKRADGSIATLINHTILIPDKETIIIKANKPAAYFLQTLTYQTSFVIGKKLIEKYGNNFADHLNEGIGGTGPFKVSKYERGRLIEFVPNEHYYGAKPQLKKVVMLFYKQEDTVYRAYQSGQIHWATVPSAQMDAAKQLPDKQFQQIPLLSTHFYSMNYLAKPFDNIKIRQAFALALDKDLIAEKIYAGRVLPTNHIVPQGMIGYNEDLTGPGGVKSTKGDSVLAKKLFEEGMKEEGYTLATLPQLTFTYSSQGSTDARNEVAAIQQMWQSVLGVTLKVDDLDFQKLLEVRRATINNPKGLQMWKLYWTADYPDPQNWLTLLFTKRSNMNYGQNQTKVAEQQQANQALMEQADINTNADERIKQYQQAEQALVNDVSWIPLYQDTRALVRKPCVIGVVNNAQGFIAPDDWDKIYISTAPTCANVDQYN